ncbi:MAG TPA: hypothetical protein VND21_00030 [Planctomycetota bacterium]|nr:hypothetical protein [Planctomycetota bacterium]
MDATQTLLEQLIELTETSIRLQKFSIVLQAESVAYQSASASGIKSRAAIDRLIVKAVKQMRATVERVSAGRALPK